MQRPSRLFVRTALAMLVLFGGPRPGFAAEQLLPPDEAFKFKASLNGTNTVVAEFVVAKNHYLYKTKTRFALKNCRGVMIREVSLPAGEMKSDPFFGLIEVYKVPIRVEIAIDRAPRAKAFTLLASYQGCNEKLGVCYPPIEKTVEMRFPQ